MTPLGYLILTVGLIAGVYWQARACLKTARGPVFRGKGRMARRNEGASPQRADCFARSARLLWAPESQDLGSQPEEKRSQTAFCAKTPRAAVLLAAAGVGSALTARCGDAPASPPWPQPKSLAAGPLGVFKQTLGFLVVAYNRSLWWFFGCLFVPFVDWFFLFLNFKATVKPFGLSLLGFLVACLGAWIAGVTWPT